MTSVRLGAHLSVAGGLDKAVEAAIQIGADCLQIFSGPPRSWESSAPNAQEVARFKRLAKEHDVRPIFIHAKYLVSLTSDHAQVRVRSGRSLIKDLRLAHQIKAMGVIFHPRLHNLDLLSEGTRSVLQNSPSDTVLILEGTAQTRLKAIGQIMRAVKSPRVKFCLDLAHIFQAGYNITTAVGVKQVFSEIRTEIGFENWVLIHANDSKTSLGSRHDRHADIGEGKMGLFPFEAFLTDPFARTLPFILETPSFKIKGLTGDLENLAKLRKIGLLGKN